MRHEAVLHPRRQFACPHIVACEAGLAIECEKVDPKTQTTSSGHSFLDINPKGSIPALVLTGGEVLTEVPTILLYLAAQAPDARLLPEQGSLDRYRVQEWLAFIGTELHKGFDPLWKAAMPTLARQLAVEDLHRCIAHLEICLQGRFYLVGEQFTVADAYCFTVLSWARFHRVNLLPYGNLGTFMRRIAGRPGVKKALAEEGLVTAA
ncbi:glutathione binding-like protein [Microvirga roseola]|uniref:glutathione binding-like protein n=1 Tax=Microvirga roseola TaxID=2883126 RepID=UPI001E32D08E|nr:glutathione binding-like protein [Microvirga roseola]